VVELTNTSAIRERALRIADTMKTLADQLGDKGGANALAAGKVLEFTNDFPRAAAHYEQAYGADPRNLEALARLALVQLKNGAVNEGLRHAAALVAANPKFQFKSLGGTPMSALTVLGAAMDQNGETDKARAAFKDALEAQPKDGYAAGRLAQYAIADGDFDTAASLVERIDAVSHSRFDGIGAALRLSKVGLRGAALTNIGRLDFNKVLDGP
jgi:tetratricopeptide (TPR) repeat protein